MDPSKRAKWKELPDIRDSARVHSGEPPPNCQDTSLAPRGGSSSLGRCRQTEKPGSLSNRPGPSSQVSSVLGRTHLMVTGPKL